jgi:lauroyl/myristoyl acyltransferase
MNIQDISTNKSAVAFALFTGKVLPIKLSYWLSKQIADWVSSRQMSSMVQAVRANQWHIKKDHSQKSLDLAVRAVFRHAARCISDLSHYLGNPAAPKSLFIDTPESQGLIERSQKGHKGLFIVAPHMSNFDLVMLALGQSGLKAQILSYSQPGDAYRTQNTIREKSGMEITPISPSSLIQALRRLKEGGIVVTGIDRPVPDQKEYLNFFNSPAPLPTGHIRLSLKADVEVAVVAARMNSDGKYKLLISQPIELKRFPDSKREIKHNAETVLKEVEKYILQAPDQWLMYYPVWPNNTSFVNIESKHIRK